MFFFVSHRMPWASPTSSQQLWSAHPLSKIHMLLWVSKLNIDMRKVSRPPPASPYEQTVFHLKWLTESCGGGAQKGFLFLATII
jgi:hypothetical protein